jgi:hypothetical protein
MVFDADLHNGRQSAVNRAQDGSTYPSLKIVPSSVCIKNVSHLETQQLFLGIGYAISGRLSPIKQLCSALLL